MPHLLSHWPALYNGHLRGQVTLTAVAERLAVELSKPVLTTKVCPERRSNSDHLHARRTLYHYATASVLIDCHLLQTTSSKTCDFEISFVMSMTRFN